MFLSQTILLFMALMASVSKDKIPDDRTTYDVRGPVKTFSESKYPLSGSEKEEVDYYHLAVSHTLTMSFNRTGGILSFVQRELSTSSRAIYTYGQNSLLISEKAFSQQNDSVNMIYIYDSNGNKLKDRHCAFPGDCIDVTTYQYDRYGRIIKQSYGGPMPSRMALWETFKYYQNGRQVRHEVFTQDSTMGYYQLLIYDDQKNIIEAQDYEPNGKLRRKVFKKYNASRQEIEMSEGNSKGKVSLTYRTQYDKYGHVLKMIFYKDGKVDGSLSHKYVYDAAGNWTENTYLESDKPVYIIRRHIEYY